MSIELHKGDLPADIDFGNSVAIDTEAMGLNNKRDRLCVVQLSSGDGTAHLVQFDKDHYNAPNLKKLICDENIMKIFHYARFDVSIIRHYLDIECKPLYCTRIASMLARTYTDRHSLKELVKEILGIDLSKQQQSSDWGAQELTEEQKKYAAHDVLHLHALREHLDLMLEREGRKDLAYQCFEFIPVRASLDLAGWLDIDIFAH
jgi:ribonuclease D